MDFDDLKQFQCTISLERLKSFYEHNDVNSLEDLIGCYAQNTKLSQAFYPILSILEISLRNTIDTMLKTYIDKDWIEKEIQTRKFLHDYDYETLQKAYEETKKKYSKDKFSYGKVISNLNFGFWTNLCSKKYNDRIWTKKGRFSSVFVNYPKDMQQQIHSISLKLDSVRRFRNRVFHYEPILKNEIKLLEMYNKIKELICYLPSDNSNLLLKTDNFLEVYNKIKEKQLKT